MLTEAESEPSEQRLELLADAIIEAANAAGIGLIVTPLNDPEHPALYVSEAAARILGHAHRDLVARPILSLIADDEQLHMRELSERARRGEPNPLHFETAIRTEAGRRVPLDVSLAITKLDGEEILVTFITDISEQKQAEVALSRANALFRRLIEAAPEAIWILDDSGIRFANAAALSLFGFDSADAGLSMPVRQFVHPADVPALEQRWRRLRERRERLPPHEYRARRRDGGWLTLEVSSIAIDYEGGPAILSFARDLTQKKCLESQVLQSDRLAALGTLAGGMAHAINNPLTYVLLNLDHLSRKLPQLIGERRLLDEAMQGLKEAHDGAERVANVVRQMRVFARSDDDVESAIDVRKVLDAALLLIGNEIRHRANLVIEYEAVPLVYAARARLEQAFLNLLLHAVRALPEGEPESSEVKLSVMERAHDSVAVEVVYSNSKRAGDPLDQSSDLVQRSTTITGAGLAICHGIVTALGGQMHMQEQPGRTSFRVILPVLDWAPRRSAPTAAQVSSFLPPPERARVLVVDDDPGVGNALRLMLEEDHEVFSVVSARDALQLLLADAKFDIIFCDLMMPELTGVDLYQALCLNRPGYEKRLVFMTGGAFMSEEARFIDQAQGPSIEKPFDMQRVQSLVRRAVSARRLRAPDAQA